jgi:hypothetical protein
MGDRVRLEIATPPALGKERNDESLTRQRPFSRGALVFVKRVMLD